MKSMQWSAIAVLAFAVALLPLQGKVAHATPVMEVSQPVQATSDSHYERGQSIVYDGSDYWLFYGRSDTVTGNYDNANPDTHDYKVYLKKASSVPDLALAPATLISGVAHNANSYLGETGAAFFGVDVWAFATIDVGATAELYGWYTPDGGTTWTEVGPIVTGLSDGQAHHDEVAFDGELWVVEGSGNFTTTHSSTPKTGGWSTPLDVDSSLAVTGGLAHFFVEGSDLYLATYSNGKNYIYKYNSSTVAWDKVDEIAPPERYDPTLFKVGSAYVFAQAPWVSDGSPGGRQYIFAWSSGGLDGTFFDGVPTSVTEGKYGTNSWVDMWPIGFTDASGDTYLLYTSERDQPTAEGTGNIWYLKWDWDPTSDHYTYIQEAIDAATSTTINVADGTYTATSLASIVIAKDGLSLVGESRDGTIIDGGTWGTSGAGWPKGIHVYANDVTIQNFTVRGFTGDTVSTGGYGILFRDYAHDMPDEGYIFYSGGHVENVKSENNYSPMYALVHRNLTVRDSLIQNNLADGMFIARESDNATITGNTVLNSGDHGIWVGSDWMALGPSDNATITGNIVDGAREGGISFVASDTALISENDVSHVKGEEPEGAGGWSRGAISLKDGPSNVTVSSNVVHDNDGLGTGSGRGIGVDGTSSNVTISGNIIRNNAGGGIKVMGTTTGWTASSNSIHDNTGYGAENTTVTILDFTGNWWGSDTGPSHALNPGGTGDAVSDNVAYSPWLGIGTDADPVAVGFQPWSPMTWIVNPDVCLAVGCIQQAVNLASASDTIRVKEGTYAENVVVDGKNDLTIEDFGSPKPKVTVGPGATAPIIHVKNASNVTIDGLEIDGAGNGASPCAPSGGPDTDQRFYGIRYSDSSGTVSNNEVHGIDYPTICGSGVGIYAYQSNVEIYGNNAYDFQKNGITANLAGTSSIHDNTVTGWGPSPDIAQNGIQVAFGATGTVQGNTVSGISYTGDYWAGSGILVTSYADWGYPPSYADATTNTVTDAQVGIYYGEGSGTIGGNVVSASAAGVGSSQFWGIIASDPADHAPSAFEPGDGPPPAGGALALGASAGVMTVLMSGNTLTGDGSAASVGLEVDAGYGPEDVDVTASGNTISNWGTGVLVAECTSDCSTGVFVSVDVGPDNDISGNDNGVFLDSVSGIVISGNEIHHNLNHPGSAGVGVMLWGDNDNNEISGNVIHDNDRQGIFVGHDTLVSTGNTVSGNTVYNNGLYTNPNGPDASAYGIQLWNADNNNVTYNEVYGHDDWFAYPDFDFAQGIYLHESNDNVVSGNNLHDNNYGVGLWGPDRGDGSNLINFNSIAGNSGFGVRSFDTFSVDATYNWWGACDGPSGEGPGSGDAVSTSVDYDPWLSGACDYDGDGLTDDAERLIHGTDWQNPDTDGDGCNDGEELLLPDPALGGLRDPLNPHDFYDVPVPTLHTGGTMNDRDSAVSLLADVLAVLEYAGTSDGGPPNGAGRDYDDDIDGDTAPDGIAYDRTVGAMYEPGPPARFLSAAPDGAIAILTDVLLVFAQAGHNCQAEP